jgi:hypothetical protein
MGIASLCPFTDTALAWGNGGHELTGHIAYGLLTPAARAKVDAMLAADKDPLTAPDFAARTAWADVYRNDGDKKLHYDQTHLWFFTDVELSAPDLGKACQNFPAAKMPASQGPAGDCLTNKVIQFEDELASPRTPPGERLKALKYVIALVGDLHQPFHVSDNRDDHGNCLQVLTAPGTAMKQLHHYWDDTVVDDMVAADRALHPEDSDLAKVGQRLASEIRPDQKTQWQSGDAKQWTLETFKVAQSAGYNLPPHPVCAPGMKWADYPPFLLPAAYQASSLQVTRLELKKSGVRLAWVLNKALH